MLLRFGAESPIFLTDHMEPTQQPRPFSLGVPASSQPWPSTCVASPTWKLPSSAVKVHDEWMSEVERSESKEVR